MITLQNKNKVGKTKLEQMVAENNLAQTALNQLKKYVAETENVEAKKNEIVALKNQVFDLSA